MLEINQQFMSDRTQLEKAEARILVPSYYKTVELIGKAAAALWLTKQIRRIEKMYGPGFEARCRAYMREIDDEGNV
jgi:hypothetical protein